MVEQVIKYSDGTEKVIKYRGVIVDGVLTPDEELSEVSASEPASEIGETTGTVEAKEAPAESIEDTA